MTAESFLKTKRWFLRNEDTGDVLVGQFPAEEVSQDIKNNWAKHTTLSRTRSIISYLNSDEDHLTFSARFRSENLYKNDIVKNVEMLRKMARKDPDLGRPPIVTFWVGNGHLEQRSVIDSISGLTWGAPDINGEPRQVKFTVNLIQYEDFNLADVEIYETRYHRARERDYYELLAYREYRNPLLGDAIRKRHVGQPALTPGAIVRLPSVEAIRTERPHQTSIALAGSFGRKDTPQKRLRQEMMERTGVERKSHVLRTDI